MDERSVIFVSPDTQTTVCHEVKEIEVFHPDIAILSVVAVPTSPDWVNPSKWSTAELGTFDLVQALGYPWAIDTGVDEPNLTFRGFAGHVVAARRGFIPVGGLPPPFEVYELSFQVATGMSGAPLFEGGVVHGVIIGNSEVRREVMHEEEQEDDGNLKAITKGYDLFALGIAVKSSVILSLESSLLGTTVADHLAQEKLL